MRLTAFTPYDVRLHLVIPQYQYRFEYGLRLIMCLQSRQCLPLNGRVFFMSIGGTSNSKLSLILLSPFRKFRQRRVPIDNPYFYSNRVQSIPRRIRAEPLYLHSYSANMVDPCRCECRRA